VPTRATQLAKAFLQEIEWDESGQVTCAERKFAVQFNPETLKVAFSNQLAGDNNRGTSAIQFTSRGTTKLSFEMWFDVSSPQEQQSGQAEGEQPIDDVRKLTREVALFMATTETREGEETRFKPPGCRFQWGTFLFDGIMDSLNENLEFFSTDGRPLRASVSVSLVKQDLEVTFAGPPAANTGGRQQARGGDSVQAMSARQGQPEGWQQRALDEGIENPLRVPAGTSLPGSSCATVRR